jgi:hypothetical protein
MNIFSIKVVKKSEYLLISDVHWDSPNCDRKLLKNHLDEAKHRNAKVLINGDFFCLMQGRGDPRRSKDEIRPEHNGANYLDRVIHTAVDWFAPYADTIIFIGYGNHETSIIKYQETDVLRRFIDLFNYTHKPEFPIFGGGYGGVLNFLVQTRNKNNLSFAIKYFHGSGGGGVVTKGVIQNQRLLAATSNYDAIWQGHIHELHHHTDVVETFDRNKSIIKLMHVHQIRTSSYKEEFNDGAFGFHVERGAPPKPLGGYWLELELKRKVDAETDLTYIKPTFTQCAGFY